MTILKVLQGWHEKVKISENQPTSATGTRKKVKCVFGLPLWA